jgi:agmatine deiminase
LAATPSSLGYKMPAEWEEHQATWLSWPKDPDTFPPGILPKVESAYVSVVRALGEHEQVWVMVNDAKAQARVASMIGDSGGATVKVLKTVDVWVRDYGPTYVRGRDVAQVKWIFNAWGNKYDDLLPDEEAGVRMAESSGLRTFTPGVVLEGGSIDVNGSGSVLTTRQCLLNPNRNPTMDQDGLEAVLHANLGVSNVIWLGEGIEGDDTDGHVDDIARFVASREVVVAAEGDRADRNHGPLEEGRKTLESALDEAGRKLNVTTIPMPKKIYAEDGRLPASHLNFYIANGVVLVPTFGGGSDREAIKTLEGFFPRKDVVGIDCRALVHGLGTLHCVTQQVPAPP